MIRAVLFDLDGVLVDTRDLHFRALNTALQAHGASPITRDEHAATYNGLPTAVKLDRLVKLGRVSAADVTSVKALKQKETRRLLETEVKFDPQVYCLLAGLKRHGLRMAVVSNAVRETVDIVLWSLIGRGIVPYFFDVIVTPEEYHKPKPDPEMYVWAAKYFTDNPSECLAVEDNPHGIEAATAAGCRVLAIPGPEELTPRKIWEAIGC